MTDTKRMNGNQWRSWIVAGIIGAVGSGGLLTIGNAGVTAMQARELRLELENKIEKERLERKALELRIRNLESWRARQDGRVPNF